MKRILTALLSSVVLLPAAAMAQVLPPGGPGGGTPPAPPPGGPPGGGTGAGGPWVIAIQPLFVECSSNSGNHNGDTVPAGAYSFDLTEMLFDGVPYITNEAKLKGVNNLQYANYILSISGIVNLAYQVASKPQSIVAQYKVLNIAGNQVYSGTANLDVGALTCWDNAGGTLHACQGQEVVTVPCDRFSPTS